MKKIIIFIAMFLPFAANSQNMASEIDSLLTTYQLADQFNGTALVALNGKPLLIKGYGQKDALNNKPNTENTVFQIGSITKQFTSTVILKLQEEGKLSVKDKLSKYFPGYPKGDSVTIENLLTHTSGIYNYTNDNDFMTNKIAIPTNMESMLAIFRDKPYTFSPGKGYNYSNSGYLLLGYIIQKVTGKPYETMIRELIFKPLKMNHSGFDFTHLADPDKAKGYFTYTSTSQIAAPIVDSSVSFAAGAIYSTVEDLFKWSQAVNEGKILKPASWAMAYTVVKNKYGYGWIIDSIYGKRMITHGGGIHGFNSDMMRIPQDGVTIVLLNNMSNPKLGEISSAIAAILNNKPYKLPIINKAMAVSEEILKKYIGEYELAPTFKLT
ncbi:MAG: serine hydrolase domain-containing protein, partial [Chitinophagaceae bacterium]